MYKKIIRLGNSYFYTENERHLSIQNYKQMKHIQNLPKNFNKQLLKYYVAQYQSFESSNLEEKEFILMQAHSRIYNMQVYIWTLFSFSAITLIIRMLIINNY